METTVKDRTLLFLKSQNIKMKDFETKCDLSNGYVTSMRKGFGRQKLENVLKAYPELNREWLLYGEGEMLITPTTNFPTPVLASKGTPIYNMDATCGEVSRPIDFAQEQIIGYVDMPNLSKDAAIIRANGESMKAKINDGDWIAVREIYDMEDIYYGMIYLILTNEYRMLKYIRKYEPDEDNFVILRSENKDYDDIKMRKSKILRLYVVENILALKIQF